ncbi:tryptophan synthase subunit beta [Mixta theicola]|uniref:Tryptophan synthase beta chain n=2 Tax=Mixta theicola TaxID=1458355 RepID=A0A2K1Q6K3_9GAMM|nr:tryptophan synthase subunit beta [Mixta theicola]PNS10680.1 tryptophan synthase subunit beta [Mixta theicola]
MMNYKNKKLIVEPDGNGLYGIYGGEAENPELRSAMNKIRDAFHNIIKDVKFHDEMIELKRFYIGRPSPLYFAKRLSEHAGGAKIFLKREDLNHTGAHKINHCIGEVLLAKKMGKKKVLAETGAGQHGVALATVCALMGIECEIHMGQVDIEKEKPNVNKMKVLGCNVIPVTAGSATLKEAVDSAFNSYVTDLKNNFYAIGSVVGPAPFPEIVQYFQSIVGQEAKQQFSELTNTLPSAVVACVGGGSNSMGIFNSFLSDHEVQLIGVEPSGKGLQTDKHAATLTKGKFGSLHGFKCLYLQDENGNPSDTYSIASGLDYPGVGPQHCYLRDIGRVEYHTITDDECLDAFFSLSRKEGIIPALESAHAVAWAIKNARKLGNDKSIIVNLSGRGDKDVDFVLSKTAS